MAQIRRNAIAMMAAGIEPRSRNHTWIDVLIYLERYEVEELEFIPLGK